MPECIHFPPGVFKHSGMEVDITNLSNTAEIVTCARQAIDPCKHEESFVRPDVNGHFNGISLKNNNNNNMTMY